MGLHFCQTGAGHEVVGRLGIRTADRNKIHPPNHLVKDFPIGRLKLLFGFRVQAIAVVIMDRHIKPSCPFCHGLPDASQPNNAESFAIDSLPQHIGGCPTLPAASAHQSIAFGDAARGGENQCHDNIGGVLSQHAWGVGDRDASRFTGDQINMVYASAE